MEQKQLKKFHRNKVSKISLCFSVLVAILPILASYASGIPGFTLADVCLIPFVGLSFLAKGSRNQYRVSVKSLVLGLSFLIVFSLLACLGGYPSNISDVIIRTIRYSFYMIVLFTAGKKFIDVVTLSKGIRSVSFLGSLFIIFQAAMYQFWSILIKGYLPFLTLYTEQYSTMDYASKYEMMEMYRPTSFFLEPAHYARYCIIGIILYLFFERRVESKSLVRAGICAIGVIISTSSQGYFLLAVIICMFLFTRIKYIKSRSLKTLLYIIAISLPVIIILLLRIPIITSTLERTFSGDIYNKNTAIGARLGGFITFFDLPFLNKLIGTGFGNVPDGEWFSSAVYWLYGSGIIVFSIYIYFFIKAFIQSDRPRRYILFTVFSLFFTDDSFYSYMIIVYFSMVLFTSKKKGDYAYSIHSD